MQKNESQFELNLLIADDSERSLAETTSIEEGVIYGSSVELRQSQKKITTLKRKPVGAAKPPPRPTPGSVTYTDDESDKAYDNNPDESSLTEKPSEISSTDSQVKTNPIIPLVASLGNGTSDSANLNLKNM